MHSLYSIHTAEEELSAIGRALSVIMIQLDFIQSSVDSANKTRREIAPLIDNTDLGSAISEINDTLSDTLDNLPQNTANCEL